MISKPTQKKKISIKIKLLSIIIATAILALLILINPLGSAEFPDMYMQNRTDQSITVTSYYYKKGETALSTWAVTPILPGQSLRIMEWDYPVKIEVQYGNFTYTYLGKEDGLSKELSQGGVIRLDRQSTIINHNKYTIDSIPFDSYNLKQLGKKFTPRSYYKYSGKLVLLHFVGTKK